MPPSVALARCLGKLASNRKMRYLCLFMLCLCPVMALAELSSRLDSDHDGLSDALEQSLLVKFAPAFMVGANDCSGVPAEFLPDSVTPRVEAEEATIYGQVFPAETSTVERPRVEIHYYDLWQRDCGPHGHALDTEHVSVLVQASRADLSQATWTALYWYASAHENTVCDVSQIARASTIKGKDHGARVWVSPGKHASYFSSALCGGGCGADHCERMVRLRAGAPINLGEPGHPMNGSAFIASRQWLLAEKMATSNFPAAAIARLNQLPETEIASFLPGRHPVQGVIAVSSSTEESLATSGRNTSEALSSADDSTDRALARAKGSTVNALGRSYRKTIHALGSSAKHVGKALDPGQKGKGTK